MILFRLPWSLMRDYPQSEDAAFSIRDLLFDSDSVTNQKENMTVGLRSNLLFFTKVSKF